MKRYAVLVTLLSGCLFAGVSAEGDGEGMFKYRTQVMYASIGHLEALRAYVDGELPLRRHVPEHVDALLALNALYPMLFPPGSQHPESRALPAVWSDPRGLRLAIEYNRRAILALKQVDPGDRQALKRAVNQVRMSCGDCHYYYRRR